MYLFLVGRGLVVSAVSPGGTVGCAHRNISKSLRLQGAVLLFSGAWRGRVGAGLRAASLRRRDLELRGFENVSRWRTSISARDQAHLGFAG